MQAYLSVLQSFLSDWYLFTLDNAGYAACIAGLVLLLTAGLYSLRITSLKKINTANEKVRNEQEARINTAQQEIKQLQDELRASLDLAEKEKSKAETETQRALGLENDLTQHTKQLADCTRNMAADFDLDFPVPAAGEDFEITILWQQHQAVLGQLTERLRTQQQITTELQQVNQTEMAKLAAKEEFIATLESRLGEQALQLTQLESDLEERSIQLQQQQDKIQQLSAVSHETQDADSRRLKELEQQSLEWANTRQQVTQLEEKIKSQDALIKQLESEQQAESMTRQPEVTNIEREESHIESEQTYEEPSVIPENEEVQPLADAEDQVGGGTGKFRHWLDVARQRVSKLDQKLTEQEINVVEPEQSTMDRLDEVESVATDRDVQAVPSNKEQQPNDTGEEQMDGLTEKIKNLFGLSKPSAVKKEQKQIEPHRNEILSASSDAEQEPFDTVAEQSGNVTGVFKKLFGIGSQTPAQTESQPAEFEQVDTETDSRDQNDAEIEGDDASTKMPARIKGLWGKLTSKGE